MPSKSLVYNISTPNSTYINLPNLTKYITFPTHVEFLDTDTSQKILPYLSSYMISVSSVFDMVYCTKLMSSTSVS
jgi:hypothetical protein